MKNLLTYEQFINESKINEGNVKQFEMAMKNLINNIRRGYGWIDPEYVYDTVVTNGEFGDFNWKDIKDEVYQRLIDQNLLFYANDADPEVKGQKVSKVSQIKESVNESWSSSDVDKAEKLISKEIGVQPGYFFIGDEDLIKQFDKFWKEKKYKQALNLLIDIENFKDLEEYIKQNESKVNEANNEFVPATLIKDFEDLRKDQIIKINALDFTQGADKETVECIRPDGKKMEIKKAIIEVKI